MRYYLCLVQENGTRPYLGQRLTFSAVAPLHPENAPVNSVAGATAELMARAAGWEYFNNFITPGSIGVEIGVDHGDGAVRLLERNPAGLFLVDPWKSSDEDGWFSQDQETMDARARFVANRFKDDSRVTVCRCTSDEFFAKTPDNSFDWAFIDGDHSVEGAYKDLVNAFRTVKPGGYIAGDDMHGCAKWMDQVRAAYDRFMKEHGHQVEVIWDQYAPFILRKKGGI